MKKLPWHISVLIPARDEEALLPRCLQSVVRAVAAVEGRATSDIVVVDDCSTDRTAALAREFLADHGFNHGLIVASPAGVVGEARALAAEQAVARAPLARKRTWLANTDADCIVPETWLLDQLRLAAKGFQGFAGTVSVDTFAEHDPAVPARFRASYSIAEDGSHPHVHGANIGVRADFYLAVGGWSPLSTAEDHDLWGRLKRAGAKLISTARIEVITSGRRVGRAPHGFAGALAAHNQAAA